MLHTNIICLFFFALGSNAQQCTVDGVFAVNFTSCRTYEVCTSGVRRVHNCSPISLFDPRMEKCQSNFICPDTTTCINEGVHADPNYPNSSNYINCTKVGNNYAVTYLECGSNEIFVPPTSPSTSANCTIDPQPPTIPSANCSNEVYPEYHTNCNAYNVCTRPGIPIRTYRCSPISLFDPWLKKCIVGYQCLENRCTSVGLKALDINYPMGNRYYECISDMQGRLRPRYLQCGTYQTFNETSQLCG